MGDDEAQANNRINSPFASLCLLLRAYDYLGVVPARLSGDGCSFLTRWWKLVQAALIMIALVLLKTFNEKHHWYDEQYDHSSNNATEGYYYREPWLIGFGQTLYNTLFLPEIDDNIDFLNFFRTGRQAYF